MLKSSYTGCLIEAGIDEAGRGCFAGPVFAAAVIFSKDYKNPLINDSKKISEIKRYAIRSQIEKDALAYAIAKVDNERIDEINILNASYLAMNKAVEQLKTEPLLLLVDGNRFINHTTIKHQCIVKGDQKYLSIAAASILAKTYRDEYMGILHEEFPMYDWKNNKGYPTRKHKIAIARFGITQYHRKSFNINEQLKLFQ